MDRFEIATGKYRDDKEPEEDSVESFGFENDFEGKGRRPRPTDYFRL